MSRWRGDLLARAHTRDSSGFTLIELVVVLFILTLVTAVTIPALLSEPAPDDDLTAAARRVESLFRLARDSAIRSGTTVTVLMDSATAAVWLLTDGLQSAGTTLPSPSEGGAEELADHGTPLGLPASVALGLGVARARFTFLPSGATMADSLVLSSGATAIVLTLDPWTGDVAAR